MSYRITIEKLVVEEVGVREWKQTGVDENKDPTFDYVHSKEMKSEWRSVYKQNFEELDIASVALFVNKRKDERA